MVQQVKVAAPEDAVNDYGTYGSVRSLRRGLEILRSLGRGHRTASEVAADTGLNRTSVYRLLTTLEQVGYVTRCSDGGFRLTTLTLTLSAGVSPSQRLAEIAEPVLRDLTRSVEWPANLATYEGGWMVVQASTHRQAPRLRFRDMTGQRVPMFSGLGRSYLASLDLADAAAIIRSVANHPLSASAVEHDRGRFQKAIANTQVQGYSVGVEEVERGMTSLALPIRRNDVVVASINLVTTSSTRLPELLGHHLPALRDAARSIEAAIALEDKAS